MLLKKRRAVFLAGWAFAAAIGLSAAAQATTYNIDVDACGGSGCGLTNYGTIEVTDVGGTGTDLHIVASLVSTAQFHDGPATHPTFVFNLNATTLLGVSIDPTSNNLPLDIDPPHTSGWQFTSVGLGSYSPAGLGTFNFEIDCSSGESGGVCGPKLIFDVTGTGLSLFSTLVGTKNVFFSLDVSNSTVAGVLTGSLGATLGPPGGPDTATPLPAAVWLFGTVLVGGAGISRWRKKRKQALAA